MKAISTTHGKIQHTEQDFQKILIMTHSTETVNARYCMETKTYKQLNITFRSCATKRFKSKVLCIDGEVTREEASITCFSDRMLNRNA